MGKTKVYKFSNMEEADTTKMTFEELQNYCLQMFELVTNERKAGEEFQIERDKLLQFWNFSSNSLKEAMYDLRDHELTKENNEYSLKTEVDRKAQEVRNLQGENSDCIERALIGRCTQLAKEHEIMLEKTSQTRQDLRSLNSRIVDVQILGSEILTNRFFETQKRIELITKNLLKQRNLDLDRVKKEMRKDRKRASKMYADKFRNEVALKKNIIQSTVDMNRFAIKRLLSTFERILSYNFETICNLKEEAENLKKMDIMLSKEYTYANKSFYLAISSHAEGMRTLNEMRTFLYAASKTENSLANQQRVLESIRNSGENASLKILNKDLRIQRMEEEVKELEKIIINYRKIATLMFYEDSDVLSKQLEQSIVRFYEQKVKLHSLINADKKLIDLKWELADMDGLTYTTENLGHNEKMLLDLREACASVVALYRRLFKLWKYDMTNLSVMLNEPLEGTMTNIKKTCPDIQYL